MDFFKSCLDKSLKVEHFHFVTERRIVYMNSNFFHFYWNYMNSQFISSCWKTQLRLILNNLKLYIIVRKSILSILAFHHFSILAFGIKYSLTIFEIYRRWRLKRSATDFVWQWKIWLEFMMKAFISAYVSLCFENKSKNKRLWNCPANSTLCLQTVLLFV